MNYATCLLSEQSGDKGAERSSCCQIRLGPWDSRSCSDPHATRLARGLLAKLLSRTGVARRAFTAEVICERLLRNVHRLAQQNEQVSSVFLYSRPILSVQHRNSPNQIIVRKLRFPLREEGRESSAEAFFRGRACGSSSFQSPWLSTCKSNQRCVIPTTYNTYNHNLESLNEATKMLSEAFLVGPWDHSCKLSEKHFRAHDVRGSSAEGPRKPESQHWFHTHTFASEILSSLLYGKIPMSCC